ncbi:MFS transporter [Salininema proteolyticum]|uniref:MFS transporter n=1 Tax=Salininema proteolyticum TaxID=1607685 RepID=A0ABV8U0F8_9ACTN
MTATLTKTRSRTRPTAVLALACAVPLLVFTNFSSTIVIMPRIAEGLHAGPVGQTWILNGVSLGLAAPMLAVGSLADLFGRRLMFIAGAALLAATGFLAAVSTTTGVFIAARIAQGAAMAALLTSSLALLATAFPDGPGRRRATAAYGALTGAGVAVGVPIAFTLTEAFDWHSHFWTIGALAAAMGIAAPFVFTESRDVRARRFDLPGTVLLSVAIGLLMAGLIRLRLSLGDPTAFALIAAAAGFAAGFAAVERRRKEPMIDLSLFRSPPFTVSVAGALIVGATLASATNYMPTFWQFGFGLSMAHAGWLIAALSAVAVGTALAAKRIRVSMSGLVVLVMVAAAGALLLLATAVGEWNAAWTWTTALIAGSVYGLSNTALAQIAVGSVPPERAGMGSGANNSARYLGMAAGIPLVSALHSAFGMAAALVVCAAVLSAGALWFTALRR